MAIKTPMRKQRIALASILLVITSISLGETRDGSALQPSAEQLDSLTLERCLSFALEGNSDLKLAALGVQSSAAQRQELAAQRFPTIGLGAGYALFSENQRLSPAGVPNDPGAYGQTIINGDLNLAMPLFTWGKISADVGSASFRIKASESRLGRIKQEVVFQVSAAFYGILGQRQRLESARIARKSLEEHQRRVQDLIVAGKAAKVDLLKMQVRLADLDQRIIREEEMLRRQKLLLTNLMGLPINPDSFRVIGQLDSSAKSDESDWSLDTAYTYRLDYLGLQALRDAQERKLTSAKAIRFPNVAAYASGGTRWMPQADILQTRAKESDILVKAGIILALPLFQGGQISARIQQQKIALEEAEENLKKMRLQIRMEVESATMSVKAARARLTVGEAASLQAAETYRIDQEKYLLGKGTMADVLEAQSVMLEAETNYTSALYDSKISSAQMRLALGVK